MLCRALIAAAALACTLGETIAHANSQGIQRALKDLICVLVLSGMQKEDLDVNLLRKLQRRNINADDINSDNVHQECQLNASDELRILKTRRTNNNGSVNQNITSSTNTNMDNSIKTDINNENKTTGATVRNDVSTDKLNETNDKKPYEVTVTKDHNIKTRSSANDVNNTQVAKFSEALMLFADQKNVDNVMNMLQTLLKGKLVEKNNNKNILKTFISAQMSTTPPPKKPTETTTTSKSKDSDIIKVLATFVFNKPIPVESHYKLDDDYKKSLISRLLDEIETTSAKADTPNDRINDDNKTTELFSDNDYMSYNINTAETTSSVDDEYKPSVQKKLLLDQMMNGFRIQSKVKPKHALEYKANENFYVPDLKNIVKTQAIRNYDNQKQFDDYEYSKLVDSIKINKTDIVRNAAAKSLHPDVIKDIADKVKAIVLRDLKKEIFPFTEIVSSTVRTTHKSTTVNLQKAVKNQYNIQQATHAIQKLVALLEQLKPAKELTVSPIEYDSSLERKNDSGFHIDAKEKDRHNKIKPENKAPTVGGSGYRSNLATVSEYKFSKHNVPMQFHPQYPIVTYYDNNTPNNMVPPLISNSYGIQQPGGQAVINVPQEIPHHNKPNTINIITPVNHTPVININQMRPAPIAIQTSKEIPPLGIPVSIPESLNQNIVLPMQLSFLNSLNETERQRWAYILEYGRNPDKRGDLANLKNKLSQYTNYKNTPNKQESEKKFESSILNFSSTNKRVPLPAYTKLSLPTINVREHDKGSGPPVFPLSLLNTRDRISVPKMFNSPGETKQSLEKLLDFKSYKLPDLNFGEADRISSYKTFNSVDEQERERMIDSALTTGQQVKTKLDKLNTDYKQQQVFDDAVLSDIKTKLLYNDRHKADNEYGGLSYRQPLTSLMPKIPKTYYNDRLNLYNPHVKVNSNYPNTDLYYSSKREPHREHIDLSKPRDLYVPRKDPMSKFINDDIKGFHEKLERSDYYERPANVNEWYEIPKIPREFDVNTNNHDDNYYTTTNIEPRQQLPLSGGTRMSKFDDTHFKNFLKTQQKVNNMLERILATKTSQDYVPSIEAI